MKKEDFFKIRSKMPKGYDMKANSWEWIPEKIVSMAKILYNGQKITINGREGEEAIAYILDSFARRIIIQETKLEDLCDDCW